MTIDIPSIFKKSFTVYRGTQGAYVSGRWVAGSETTFTATGSMQPMKPDELLVLPEGIRTKDVKKFYTDDNLNTANELLKIPADQVDIGGKRYEVHGDMDHNTGHSAHNKVILVRVNP